MQHGMTRVAFRRRGRLRSHVKDAGETPAFPGFSDVALTHLVPYNVLVLRCFPQARRLRSHVMQAGTPALPGFSDVALTHLVPYNVLVLRCFPQAGTPALPCLAFPCQRCGRDVRAPRVFGCRLNSSLTIQRSCSSLLSAGGDACAPMSKMRARRPRSQGRRGRLRSHVMRSHVMRSQGFRSLPSTIGHQKL